MSDEERGASPRGHFGVERYVGALAQRLDRYFHASSQRWPEARAARGPARGDQALVVGIYGQWGSGKTTWLRALEELVAREQRARLAPEQVADHEGVLTVPVLFNAWQFEREPHLIVPLLKTAEATVRRAVDTLAPAQPSREQARFWRWLRGSAQILGDATVALAAGFKGEFGFGATMSSELWGAEAKLGPSARLDLRSVFDAFTERRRARRERGTEPASPLEAYESMYFDLRRTMRALTGREPRPAALQWLDGAEQRLRDARAEARAARVRAARISQLETELRWLPRWRLLRRAALREELLDFEHASVEAEREATSLALEAGTSEGEGEGDAGEGDASFRLNLLFLIDDLDRCLPEKAVEMLESIKLFLEVPGCAFVLAVDDEMIERGVMHRYRDYRFEADEDRHDDLAVPISGAEYLEKIVHLPVRVPPLLPGEIRRFIEGEYAELLDSLAGVPVQAEIEAGADAREAVLDLFERCLPHVPRKVIRAVELYWLLHGLALEIGRPDYDPLLLARLVLLQLFAPEVYRMGGRRRGRQFLVDLCQLKNQRLDDVLHELETQLEQGALTRGENTDPSRSQTLRVMRERIKADQLRALVGAVKRVIESRADFDPRDVLSERSDYHWRGRVEFHYRLITAEARVETSVSARVEGAPAKQAAEGGLAVVPEPPPEPEPEPEPEELGDLDDELQDLDDADLGVEAEAEEAEAEEAEAEEAGEVETRLPIAAQSATLPTLDESRSTARGGEAAPSKPAASAGSAPSAPAPPSERPGAGLESPPAARPPARRRRESTKDLHGRSATKSRPQMVALGANAGPPDASPKRRKSATPSRSAAPSKSAPPPKPSAPRPAPAPRRRGGAAPREAARPRDLDEFLAFASSADPGDWERALAAEEERLAGHVLDAESFAALFEIICEQPERFDARWMNTFGPYLSFAHRWRVIARHRGSRSFDAVTFGLMLREAGLEPEAVTLEWLEGYAELPLASQTAQLLREVDYVPRALAEKRWDDVVASLSLVARQLNPPHEYARHRLAATEWIPKGADLRGCSFVDARLVGLDLRGLKLPVKAEAWARADLRDVEIDRSVDPSRALRHVDPSSYSLALPAGRGAVHALAIWNDRIAAGYEDGFVRVWSGAGELLLALRAHEGPVRALCAWGEELATAGDDDLVRRLSSSGEVVGQARTRVGPVHALALAGADTLAIAGRHGAWVWPRSGEDAHPLKAGVVGTIGPTRAMGRIGDLLVLATELGPIHSYSLDRGLRRTIGAPPNLISSMCGLPEGRMVTGLQDGAMWVWGREGDTRQTLTGHRGPVHAVCPWRGQIASAGDDGSIHLWDPEGALLRELLGHAGPVLCLSTWGQRLVSGGDDGTVRVWSRRGEPLVTIRGLDGSSKETGFPRATPLSNTISLRIDPDSDWPITFIRTDRPWQAHDSGATPVPSDPELHRWLGLVARSTRKGEDAAELRLPIHALDEGIWRWDDPDTRRRLSLRWPRDPAIRERLRRALTTPEAPS